MLVKRLSEGTSSVAADCVSETSCWGGEKKGSLHKTVSLELASQLERKMVTCSFFFFFSVSAPDSSSL